MRTALIMAGGQGERMARSGIAVPKPLVPVGGVPLLERNLQQLIRARFERVVIAVSRGDRQVRRFIEDRLVPLASTLKIEIEVLPEVMPLGNIGAAGRLRDRVDSLLVVYADNLTTLNLAEIYRDHVDRRSDLTLAAHCEPFCMPFGELRLDPEDPTRVVDYLEKPIHEVLVCSAVIVLGRVAMAVLPADRPTGISQLARRLVASGAVVRAWRHSDPWIDVNDAAAATRAEEFVARHHETFETWWPGSVERWQLVVSGDDAERAVAPVGAVWVPVEIEPRGGYPAAEHRDPGERCPVGTFDVVDQARGRVVRAHVSAIRGHGARTWLAGAPQRHDAPDSALLLARVLARLALQPRPTGGDA